MSSLSERAGANLKEARVGGGKLWGDRSTQRQAQRSTATDGRSTHRRAQLERAQHREAGSKPRTLPGGIPRPPHAQAGALLASLLPTAPLRPA
ncbi:rCG24136, isoform CRA_b [Rattus norvegicus]|uniref:RCG24136, isoform CRA_b n=1 Tax=Rattus norvegicus TaxID=10116 RepID=A6KAN3_RAT|nr:rCG24136, isoform CRA_b [Rattus norvegicus]